VKQNKIQIDELKELTLGREREGDCILQKKGEQKAQISTMNKLIYKVPCSSPKYGLKLY